MTNEYVELCATKIPWIGAIPCHWEQTQLRAVLIPKKVQNKGMLEDNLLSLSYGRIVLRNIASSDGLLPRSFETYQIVEGDDLIFRFTDLQNDKRSLRSARVTERGIITSAYLAATPAGINARYAEYLMRSYDLAKVFYGLGGGVRQSLKFSDVALLPVLLPPQEEQRAIADYLDRETQKIDDLITEQRDLIETLRERRQAVIDSVFGAHDVNSRMYAACLDVVDCLHSTPDVDLDGEYEAVRTASVRNGVFREGRGQRVSESTWRERNAAGAPQLGDVLFTREAPAGEACMVPSSRVCLGQRMVLLRVNKARAEGRFIMWQIYSRVAQEYFWTHSNGSTVSNVRLPLLRGLPIWLPRLGEQRTISAYLDDQTSRIDDLISESEDLITLSQERRAALITAAVTGQIDVRTAS